MAGIVAQCNIAVGIRRKSLEMIVAYCNSPVQNATQRMAAGRKTGASGPAGSPSPGRWRQGIHAAALFSCRAEKRGGSESAGKRTSQHADAAASGRSGRLAERFFGSVVPKVEVESILQDDLISFGPCFEDGACYAIFFLIGKNDKIHLEKGICFSGRQ